MLRHELNHPTAKMLSSHALARLPLNEEVPILGGLLIVTKLNTLDHSNLLALR
jgi:hypothetical protein